MKILRVLFTLCLISGFFKGCAVDKAGGNVKPAVSVAQKNSKHVAKTNVNTKAKFATKKTSVQLTQDPGANAKIQQCLDIGADELPSADQCPYEADFGTACCECAFNMAQSPGWPGILSSKRYNPESFLGGCSAQCSLEFPTPCDYICSQAFPAPTDCSSATPESPKACALFKAKKADCLKRCASNLKNGFGCSAGLSGCFGPKQAKWGDASFCSTLANTVCAGDKLCLDRVKKNCMNGGKTYYSEHSDQCTQMINTLCADTNVCGNDQRCLNDKNCTQVLQATMCGGTAMPLFECGNKETCLTIANTLCKRVNADVLPKDEQDPCRDADGKEVDCACRDAFVKICMGDCQFGSNNSNAQTCQKACFDKAKSDAFLNQFQELGRGGPYGWCDRLGCNTDCPESAQPGPLCKSCLRKCLYQASSMQEKQIACIQTECAHAESGDTRCIDKCQAQFPIIDCRFYCLGKAPDCGVRQDLLDKCDARFPCTSSFADCNYQVGTKCTSADDSCSQTVGVGHYYSTCDSNFGECNCQPNATSCYNNYLCKSMAYPDAGCKNA